MTIEVARYQFHSWARRGMSANITDADDLGSGTVHTRERATVPVALKANATDVSKNFALIGPGDIIGINRDMIVRTEPLNWITDFEPNYLAFIEFYDEDFSWRYTPAQASGERLRPWVALLVLEDDEFERTQRRVPLPSINVKDRTAMPPANELWMWAHVHSNVDLPDSDLSTYERFLNSLNTTITTDPDGLYSRLMSPRHLKPNTAYTAFVVPTFETGRLAGLGQATDTVDAQQPAWAADGTAAEMPVYFEWYFRTGENEDFESLANLLVPRPMDPRVGIRDMDCSAPGFVKADGSGPIPATSPPILGLEAALKAPTTVSTVFPDPPASNDFQAALEDVVNLGEQTAADTAQDPIVTMPLYGKNHVRQHPEDVILLDITQDRWLDELNRDPRTRTMAGVGSLVIQENQDRYMKSAWQQVDKVNQANRAIRNAKAAIAFATPLFTATFRKLPTTQLVAISRAVLPRVMGSPTTLFHQLTVSRLPVAALSAAFRRFMRPRGPFARRTGITADNFTSVVDGLNDGTLTAAPPRPTPAGLPTTTDLGGAVTPPAGTTVPPMSRLGLLILILLVVLIVIVLLATAGVGAALLAAVVGAAVVATVARRSQAAAAAHEESTLVSNPATADTVLATVPARPDFNVRLLAEATAPSATPGGANGESKEAQNFRSAVTGLSQIAALAPPELPPPTAYSLSNAQARLTVALEPRMAHGTRLSRMIKIRNVPWTVPSEPLVEAMAYPDFDEPMYKKLTGQSDEFLVANLKLIPPNTISLLETNEPVIESYMVGLNYEMGRTLLWSEFPTDERGSYFRQFWDVSGLVEPSTGKTPAQLAEEHKDITPIHTWTRNSRLGTHNNRDAQGDTSQIVLVVRGDLLKRYPNSVVFAQKAIAGSGGVPVIDLDLTGAEFTQELLFPLYRADIAPDIKFFGFDLTARQARGDDPSPGFLATDTLGWFFVIQEVPGEPRFGMDISYDPGSDGVSWNDLAWTNFPAPNPDFITASPHPTGFSPTDNSPDKWATSSANMAYVLFQEPSMVAVHASEMLASL